MCSPTLALGAAGIVGGQIMNNSANNAVAKARSRAMAAEQARQKAFSAEAFKAFDSSKAALERPAQDLALADAVAKRQAALLDTVSRGGGMATPVGAGSAPQNVKAEAARRMNDALVAGRETAKRLGTLSGFGDLQFDNSVKMNDSSRRIGLQGNLAQGSAAVLPWELEAANQKGAGRRMFGDILGAGGNLSMMAGLAGLDPFAALFAGKPATGLNSYTRQNAQALRGL